MQNSLYESNKSNLATTQSANLNTVLTLLFYMRKFHSDIIYSITSLNGSPHRFVALSSYSFNLFENGKLQHIRVITIFRVCQYANVCARVQSK